LDHACWVSSTACVFDSAKVPTLGDGDDAGAETGADGVKRHEVISTMVALRRAKEAGLDLVEAGGLALQGWHLGLALLTQQSKHRSIDDTPYGPRE
jgi:hypothetical protein